MADLNVGYLYRKKQIKYQSNNLEIYQFIDYVAAISFINKDNNYINNIISGNNAGGYAFTLNTTTEIDLVFIHDDLSKTIKENGGMVDFEKIRKNKISNSPKYYIKNDNGYELKKIENDDLINFLEKYSCKSEYDEEIFEKNSSISAMYSSIKRTIISQDEQIMQILTSLFKNQKVVESNLSIDLIAKLKENILIYGPTGTGKTEILKRISKLYDIPIVIEITDMLEDLCFAANGDVKKAEKGILVIDEFDKLAEKIGDSESHVSRIGVQRSLLKLLDGALFYFNNKQFDSSKLTIVGIGAFTKITKEENYKKLTTDDFVNYGIMRELIGRFSKTIAMNQLNKEDIIKILKKSDFSPLNTYKKLFEMLQVQFDFNDEFIEYIAEIALAKKSGARGLKTVFDDCLSSALFKIFAGEYSKISLIKPNSVNEKPYVLNKKRPTNIL